MWTFFFSSKGKNKRSIQLPIQERKQKTICLGGALNWINWDITKLLHWIVRILFFFFVYCDQFDWIYWRRFHCQSCWKKTPFTITMEKKMNKKNELLSADSLNTNNLLGTFNIGLPLEVFANLHGNRPIKIKIEMNVNKLQWKCAIAALPSQKCFYLYSSH